MASAETKIVLDPTSITAALRKNFLKSFDAAHHIFRELFPDADMARLAGLLRCEEQAALDGCGRFIFLPDSPDSHREYMEQTICRYGCLWRRDDGEIFRPAARLKDAVNCPNVVNCLMPNGTLVREGEHVYIFKNVSILELPPWIRPHTRPMDAIWEYAKYFLLPVRQCPNSCKGND